MPWSMLCCAPLRAVLAGEARQGGLSVAVTASGVLAELVERLRNGAAKEVGGPRSLRATLRPYQERGLNWLVTMGSLGLGACLADDMGLGKTMQLLAFLLRQVELRGRTKDQVLDALHAARGGATETTMQKRAQSKPAPPDASLEVPTVNLGKLKAGDYDKLSQPLPLFHFSFEEPITQGAVLRQLGAPPAWQSDASPADVLAPLVRAAAETARRIAMAEPSDANESAPAPKQRSAKPRERKANGARPRGSR